MFPFSSDSAYDSVIYDQVKTRLSGRKQRQRPNNELTTMHILMLCDWLVLLLLLVTLTM